MEFNPRQLDLKWQKKWKDDQTYRVDIQHDRPKYYVLDMFPYPSGAGLHVGHPLGYIASDIFARYKRLRGYNVLHPMGFDSFGLPAEQYAIETGQHPAATTEVNARKYIEQLQNIGFSFDWAREVRTSNPDFYKWTQWIFGELFGCWYNRDTDRAEPIETLTATFAANGTDGVNAVCDQNLMAFSAADWSAMTPARQYEITLDYRLTYLAFAVVNWCPALGTVLANDEVKDGVSERGGHPVEQKKMRQWMMRITAYADRLLSGLDTVDWSEAIKEQQRNWIGRSVGAEVLFGIEGREDTKITVYTTRVDTIFGVSFMVLAPEHELVSSLTTDEQRTEIDAYIARVSRRTERDRMTDAKAISGVFTGSYCINPFSGERVQIWIADYVLAGYGTGAVMAVPSGDQRDWNFAKHFNLPIIQILDSQQDVDTQADNTKEGRYVNSGIINGMTYKEATETLLAHLEIANIGRAKTQYRIRDAVFSRQRYWGEPVPVYFKTAAGVTLPYLVEKETLPLVLPAIDKYLPTASGEPPLGRADDWKYHDTFDYELSTMPGWAGSSWYWYRYMDPNNDQVFASKEAIDYWQDVDLYLGGSEHATGHLLYSRFWNKFLKDRGIAPVEEPFKKLINQGMIQGVSSFVHRGADRPNIYVSADRVSSELTPEECLFLGVESMADLGAISAFHVDVNIVENDILAIDSFINWREANQHAQFVMSADGKYRCSSAVEKMSKSKYNVVNPDDVIAKYGADVFRMYEMFLGPIEQAKPWDTRSIDGVVKFLRRAWSLFYNENGQYLVTDEELTAEENFALHTTLKKITEDIERFSFNTCVSAFMVCVNELKRLQCNKKAALADLLVCLAPFAPHTTEELWLAIGGTGSIHHAAWPVFNPAFLAQNTVEYPVSINGKKRADLTIAADATVADIEAAALALPLVQKWLDGAAVKKVVIVPKRMVNLVV